MEVQQRADGGATESRWRCDREQMEVRQRSDGGATESRWRCDRKQIPHFICGENVNSEMKTTGTTYNKMLETKLWHCSVCSSTCNTLRHEQHSANLRPLAWLARLKRQRNWQLMRDWQLTCGRRNSRIPATLEGGRDWRRRLATSRCFAGWGYSETWEDQNDVRTKVILGFTGTDLATYRYSNDDDDDLRN